MQGRHCYQHASTHGYEVAMITRSGYHDPASLRFHDSLLLEVPGMAKQSAASPTRSFARTNRPWCADGHLHACFLGFQYASRDQNHT